MQIDFFMNDRFKVLSYMASCQICVKGKYVVPLSQQEIADELELSKKKINSIIAELKNNGYIKQRSQTRGKYILTHLASDVLSTVQDKGALTNG